ncbi:unnamed protein product [Nyctereutes procyonoides]|uniref:(raccoon dog) hypothetical protein n=1 Tax=Nyctereutes procyonoides TaxID=34880 RepID=A0A811YG10_NYCPR|nr:unnamed protein product [Nyctereutes procyonoides]
MHTCGGGQGKELFISFCFTSHKNKSYSFIYSLIFLLPAITVKLISVQYIKLKVYLMASKLCASLKENHLAISQHFKCADLFLSIYSISQAPCREPDVGFDPWSPGSHPGPKAGAKPLRHPGIPVNEFLKENTDNDKLIGVHCTHGLNRTGYLICRYLIDVQGAAHCLERQNYTEDLQKDLIRRNRDSSVSRSSGFKDTTHMMEPVHTTIKSVNQGHWYNLHQTQGYPVPSRHFHSQTQDLQQSVRKFSQNQNIYQRGHIPPPGATGEDYSQRRYSWNIKPNASQGAQNAMWYPGSYYRLSCPTYCGWTE